MANGIIFQFGVSNPRWLKGNVSQGCAQECYGWNNWSGRRQSDRFRQACSQFNQITDCYYSNNGFTDAPCSSMSVVYDKTGNYIQSIKMRANPDIVLVDTGVIAKAPGEEALIAGWVTDFRRSMRHVRSEPRDA
jgi:hypothetical protein